MDDVLSISLKLQTEQEEPLLVVTEFRNDMVSVTLTECLLQPSDYLCINIIHSVHMHAMSELRMGNHFLTIPVVGVRAEIARRCSV